GSAGAHAYGGCRIMLPQPGQLCGPGGCCIECLPSSAAPHPGTGKLAPGPGGRLAGVSATAFAPARRPSAGNQSPPGTCGGAAPGTPGRQDRNAYRATGARTAQPGGARPTAAAPDTALDT